MALWFHHIRFLWPPEMTQTTNKHKPQLHQDHRCRHGPWLQLKSAYHLSSKKKHWLLTLGWLWWQHDPWHWVVASMWTLISDYNTDPGCITVRDLDIAISSSSGPDDTVVLDSSTVHSDLYGHTSGAWPVPGIHMALCGNWRHRHQHNYRTTRTDIVLDRRPCLDITMDPGGSRSHPDHHGPNDNMALEHQYGLQVVL